MKIGSWYQDYIRTNCLRVHTDKEGLQYLSNQLFADILIYLLPFATLAAGLGIMAGLQQGLYAVVLTDVLAWVALAFISFNRLMHVKLRKLLFIGVLYTVSCSLFFNLGTMGPGMLYFLVCTVMTVLIFPKYTGYYSVGANVLCCVLVGVTIHTRILPTPLAAQYTLDAWIAVSVNIVVYSLLMVILIPRLFYSLEKSHSRYEAVARATADTVWDYDLAHRTCQYNKSFTRTFGYGSTEVGPSVDWWYGQLHPDDKAFVESSLQEAIARTGKCSVEYRLRCKDGSYKYVLHRGIVVRNKAGQPQRVVGTIQDISPLREYIDAIESQNAQLKQIAWVQSHKMRRPVATILGLASLFKEGDDENCATDNALIISGIVSSSQELDDMIHEVNSLTQSGLPAKALTGLEEGA